MLFIASTSTWQFSHFGFGSILLLPQTFFGFKPSSVLYAMKINVRAAIVEIWSLESDILLYPFQARWTWWSGANSVGSPTQKLPFRWPIWCMWCWVRNWSECFLFSLLQTYMHLQGEKDILSTNHTKPYLTSPFIINCYLIKTLHIPAQISTDLFIQYIYL